MRNVLLWLAFGLTTVIFGILFLTYPVANSGGDMVEYFGMTESIVNHGGLSLSDNDYNNLRKYLNPGYFVDPESVEDNGGFLYYMRGKEGNKYPVHFSFYSLLLVPGRVTLQTLGLSPLLTFSLTNLTILTGTVFIIMKYMLKTPFKRLVFLLLVYLSPIIFFLVWPGPDIYYISFLLLGIFLFYHKKYATSLLLFSLASWHSQPLIVFSLGTTIYYFLKSLTHKFELKVFLTCCFMVILMLVPYLQNLLVFGMLTPWSVLPDGWTQLNGFGIQNISLKKLFEQFFDFNVGLFWYAPLLMLGGMVYILRKLKGNTDNVFFLLIIILTALFYQTNPSWHFGTAGYGPTRHILFVIPFLIYYLVQWIGNNIKGYTVLSIIMVTQIYLLSLNNFTFPKFENTHVHSFFAKFVLDHYPWIYNPTPEIFVDRTNHNDLKKLKTAIYISSGKCKKAFVLKTDADKLKKECNVVLGAFSEDTYVDF